MKIFIDYNITDKPWGGGNSFLKAFRKLCIANGIELAKYIKSNYDIYFANGAHRGQGKFLNLTEICSIKYNNASGFYRFINRRKSSKKVIYRSDGFRSVYARKNNEQSDTIQKAMLHIADHIIFQNEFSLKSAQDVVGFNLDNYSIIQNGVDQKLFRLKNNGYWTTERKLKVLSVNWSSNHGKGYKEIAEFSKFTEIESYFIGNWPKDINPENVKLLNPITQEELAKEYKKYDVLFHPSMFDASPNVCLEAISCGLPAIYHSTSGVREIAGEFGIEYDHKEPYNTLREIKNKYSTLVEFIKSNRERFSMDRCFKEYIDIFEKVNNDIYQ